jgi:hypothetical protein
VSKYDDLMDSYELTGRLTTMGVKIPDGYLAKSVTQSTTYSEGIARIVLLVDMVKHEAAVALTL